MVVRRYWGRSVVFAFVVKRPLAGPLLAAHANHTMTARAVATGLHAGYTDLADSKETHLRILLTPFGSRGDVEPMLALGEGLVCRGHRVTVATDPVFAQPAADAGLDFVDVGGDIQAWLRNLGREASNPYRLVRALAAYTREQLPRTFALLQPAVASSDLVVTTIHHASWSLAQTAGIPCRTILYTAQMIPSSLHPPPSVASLNLPGWINRLLWRLAGGAFNLLFRKAINQMRSPLPLPPVRDFLTAARGHAPVIASDPLFAPLAPDAPAGAVQTGAMGLNPTGDLEHGLVAWLDRGEPPVYIGFGSMPIARLEHFAMMLSATSKKTGSRFLLSAGWSEGQEGEVQPGVLAIRSAPHALLFPRVAAAIHHGGAGTTAAAARAGIPQMVIPHNGDQFYHGRCVHHRALGPPPLPRRKLTHTRLADALTALTASETVDTARILGKQLAATDGVDTTCDELLDGDRKADPGN